MGLWFRCCFVSGGFRLSRSRGPPRRGRFQAAAEPKNKTPQKPNKIWPGQAAAEHIGAIERWAKRSRERERAGEPHYAFYLRALSALPSRAEGAAALARAHAPLPAGLLAEALRALAASPEDFLSIRLRFGTSLVKN